MVSLESGDESSTTGWRVVFVGSLPSGVVHAVVVDGVAFFIICW